MSSAPTSWAAANEHVLRAAVAVMHARLLDAAKSASDRPQGRTGPAPEIEHTEIEYAEAGLRAARAAAPSATAIDQLAALFSLSPFETDLLLLCAGVELDGALADLCRQAAGPGAAPCPTFGLALAVLPGAHWSALVPTAPLRHWHLVEVAEGDLLTASAVRIDERILHELVGVGTVDNRLAGRLRPLHRDGPRPTATQLDVARTAARLWTAPANQPLEEPWPLLQLVGPPHSDRERVAVEIAAAHGLACLSCSSADLPSDPDALDVLARVLEREAALAGAALVVDLDDAADGPAAALLGRLGGPVVVHASAPLTVRGRVAHRFDLAPPTVAERRELWRAAAPGAPPTELHAVADRFPLGPGQIAAAARAASGPDAPGTLWEACRRAARPQVDRLARRRSATCSWDGLVLPPQQLDVLTQITAQARRQSLVHDDWGFAAGVRGLGVTALFAGPSGTGKTTAAEVVAADLGLDLLCIDLSAVVDKYIGETEKNLARVFDAAEGGAAVLLFDEADALFGKRSEVRDSHDRYANLEVAYLLQRMEEYRGLAILTTNARTALDPAFLRRLRFVVTFPFPDLAQRAELWRRTFPPGAPTEGLDPDRLARLTVAGGSIRNIAVNAAFLAADAGRAITTADVVRAARAEYAKLDRPLSDVELRGLQ